MLNKGACSLPSVLTLLSHYPFIFLRAMVAGIGVGSLVFVVWVIGRLFYYGGAPR